MVGLWAVHKQNPFNSASIVNAAPGNKTMKDQIEEKARKAKTNDEASVRELADAVFDYVGSPIPSTISADMKDRLVNAEMRYRGGGKAVTESHIVHTINELAEKLQAPEYAKTSLLQIRVMRARLALIYPNFIAQDAEDKEKGVHKKVGDKMNPHVSPLEAAFIVMLMAQQKMSNEEWQKTPDEFPQSMHSKRYVEHEPKSPHLSGQPHNIEKRREMWNLVTRGLSGLGASAIRDLAQSSLDTLGIER